mmetsp:Transcript_47701/g.153517  ORF Transcript_47701/g.153517 Transcript_47701/m.153517 type:complete len:294 (+) Transcript_47701:96-977(+)
MPNIPLPPTLPPRPPPFKATGCMPADLACSMGLSVFVGAAPFAASNFARLTCSSTKPNCDARRMTASPASSAACPASSLVAPFQMASLSAFSAASAARSGHVISDAGLGGGGALATFASFNISISRRALAPSTASRIRCSFFSPSEDEEDAEEEEEFFFLLFLLFFLLSFFLLFATAMPRPRCCASSLARSWALLPNISSASPPFPFLDFLSFFFLPPFFFFLSLSFAFFLPFFFFFFFLSSDSEADAEESSDDDDELIGPASERREAISPSRGGTGDEVELTANDEALRAIP